MMTTIRRALALTTCLALLAPAAVAQDIFIYPAQDQSAEQQEKDKFECYQWAKEQTGFDPMKRPDVATTPAEPAPKQGGLVKGAARGAAVGAVGGAIGGDAGKGAAVGAGVGAVGGGMRRRQATRQHEAKQEAAEQAAKDQYAEARGAWERAAKTCLQGKGYTVN
jgi:hypothetical protein